MSCPVLSPPTEAETGQPASELSVSRAARLVRYLSVSMFVCFRSAARRGAMRCGAAVEVPFVRPSVRPFVRSLFRRRSICRYIYLPIYLHDRR